METFVVRTITPEPAQAVESTSPQEEREQFIVQNFNTEAEYPFIAAALDIQDLYGKTGYEDQLRDLDNLIRTQIKGSPKSVEKSFLKIMKQAEKVLQIDDSTPWTTKIEKLFAYFDALVRVDGIERLRKIVNG